MNSITIEYNKTKDLEKKLKEHYELVAGVTIEQQIANAVISDRGLRANATEEPVDTTPDLLEGWKEKTQEVALKDDPVANPTVMDIAEENATNEVDDTVAGEVTPADEVSAETVAEEAVPEEVPAEDVAQKEASSDSEPTLSNAEFAQKIKDWVMGNKENITPFKEILAKHGVATFTTDCLTDDMRADFEVAMKEA